MKGKSILAAIALLLGIQLAGQTRMDVQKIDSLIAVSPSEMTRELTLRKATLLKRMYLFDEAASALSSIIDPGMEDLEVLGELADCHFQAGNYSDAELLYSLLCSRQMDNIGWRVRRISLESRAERFPEVVSDGRELLSRAQIPSVAGLVGDAFSKMDMKDSALIYYGKVLSMKPRSAATLSKVSDIFLGRGMMDTVVVLCRNYLAMDPGNIPIGRIKGLSHHMKGEWVNAVEIFSDLLSRGDNSYGTLYTLGQDYYQLRMYPRADTCFTAAWQKDSSDVRLALSIANTRIHCRSDYSRDVKPWFEKAVGMMAPDSTALGSIYQSWGSAESRRENYDGAIPLYRKAYSYNPSLISCLSSIGYAYERRQDWKEALSWYEKYLKVGREGSPGYIFVQQETEYVKGKLFMEQ